MNNLWRRWRQRGFKFSGCLPFATCFCTRDLCLGMTRAPQTVARLPISGACPWAWQVLSKGVVSSFFSLLPLRGLGSSDQL